MNECLNVMNPEQTHEQADMPRINRPLPGSEDTCQVEGASTRQTSSKHAEIQHLLVFLHILLPDAPLFNICYRLQRFNFTFGAQMTRETAIILGKINFYCLISESLILTEASRA